MRPFLALGLFGLCFSNDLQLYRSLAVEPESSSLAIRKAFKAKVASLTNEAHQEYNDLRLAVEVLSDESLRQRYDAEGEPFAAAARPYLNFSNVKTHPEGLFLHDPQVVSLTTPEFRYLAQHTGGIWLLNFYTPSRGCAKCHQLADQWREVGTLLSPAVNVGAVNCAVQVCSGVSHLPTIRAYYANNFTQLDAADFIPSANQIAQFLFSTLEQHGLGLLPITSQEQLTPPQEFPLLVGLCGFSELECEPFRTMLRTFALELHGVARVASLNCQTQPKLCASLQGEQSEPSVELRFLSKDREVLNLPLPSEEGGPLEVLQAQLVPAPVPKVEASLVVAGLSRLQYLVLASRVHPAGIRVDWEPSPKPRVEYRRIALQPVVEDFWGLEFSVPEIAYFALTAHRSALGSVKSEAQLRAAAESDSVLFLYGPHCTQCVLVRALLAESSALAKTDPTFRNRKFYAANCAKYATFCSTHTSLLPSVSVSIVEVPALALTSTSNSTEVLKLLNVNPKLVTPRSENELLELVGTPPLLVFLSSAACASCPSFTKTLSRAAMQLDIPVVKVDCDKFGELCKSNNFADSPIIFLRLSTSGPAIFRNGELPLQLLTGWVNRSLGRIVETDSISLPLMTEEKVTFVSWFEAQCPDAACLQSKITIQGTLSSLQSQLGALPVYHFDCSAHPEACDVVDAHAVPGLRLYLLQDGAWKMKNINSSNAPTILQELLSPVGDSGEGSVGVSAEGSVGASAEGSEEVLDLDKEEEKPAAPHVKAMLSELPFAVSSETVSLLTTRLLRLLDDPSVKNWTPEVAKFVTEDTGVNRVDVAVDSVRSSLLDQLKDLFMTQPSPEPPQSNVRAAPTRPVPSSDRIQHPTGENLKDAPPTDIRVQPRKEDILGDRQRRGLDRRGLHEPTKEPEAPPASNGTPKDPPYERVSSRPPSDIRSNRPPYESVSSKPSLVETEVAGSRSAVPESPRSAHRAPEKESRGLKDPTPRGDGARQNADANTPPSPIAEAPEKIENFKHKGKRGKEAKGGKKGNRKNKRRGDPEDVTQADTREARKRAKGLYDTNSYSDSIESTKEPPQIPIARSGLQDSLEATPRASAQGNLLNEDYSRPESSDPRSRRAQGSATAGYQRTNTRQDPGPDGPRNPDKPQNSEYARSPSPKSDSASLSQPPHSRKSSAFAQALDDPTPTNLPTKTDVPPYERPNSVPRSQGALGSDERRRRYQELQEREAAQLRLEQAQQLREQQLREQRLREQQLREQQAREQQLQEEQLRDHQRRQPHQPRQQTPQAPLPQTPPPQAPNSYGYYYDDATDPNQPSPEQLAAARAQLGGEEGINAIRSKMENYMKKVGGQAGLEKRMAELGKDVVAAEVKALMEGGPGPGGPAPRAQRVQYY